MQRIDMPVLEDGASLAVYLHENKDEILITARPLVLVLPGGAYAFLAEREGDPVADAFFQMGYHTAVLRYSVGEKAKNLQPMLEGFTALLTLREHAEEWHIKKDQIAVCGFSAGGHLAGSLGVMWKEPKILEKIPEEPKRLRPDAVILSYAVLTSGKFEHRGSFLNLTGQDESEEAIEFFDVIKRVDEETPQTFVWTTQNDQTVPVENSLMMAVALQQHHVPMEVHIFDNGAHGASTANEEVAHNEEELTQIYPHLAHWVTLAKEWLGHRFSFEKK